MYFIGIIGNLLVSYVLHHMTFDVNEIDDYITLLDCN